MYVSPGVPPELPLLIEAQRRGLPLSSATELFLDLCPAPIVGITGSSGKTTTTALTGEIFRQAGCDVFVGGNIGVPLLGRLDEIGPDAWVILELSSFQLESIARPCLDIASVLNITPDHLDRHHTFERYVDVKARAVEGLPAGGHAALNADDPVSIGLRSRTRARVIPFSTRSADADGLGVEAGWIVLPGGTRVMPAADVPLPGEHNLSNVLAALAAGWAAGVSAERMAAAVRAFPGVEHRLELVGSFDGVRWYNDSKATNPDSTFKALAAFDEPIVLIAGGRNKGIDLQPLATAIASRVTALVAMGETGEELASRVRAAGLANVSRASDLKDAVRQARNQARSGSVVLLSPAFACYDMFRDYEDRGRQFKAAVREEVGEMDETGRSATRRPA
jgi:UDP-N-acetylmuramoylalanine--D-glutamate ligase